jgi:hypothetical protein
MEMPRKRREKSAFMSPKGRVPRGLNVVLASALARNGDIDFARCENNFRSFVLLGCPKRRSSRLTQPLPSPKGRSRNGAAVANKVES